MTGMNWKDGQDLFKSLKMPPKDSPLDLVVDESGKVNYTQTNTETGRDFVDDSLKLVESGGGNWKEKSVDMAELDELRKGSDVALDYRSAVQGYQDRGPASSHYDYSDYDDISQDAERYLNIYGMGAETQIFGSTIGSAWSDFKEDPLGAIWSGVSTGAQSHWEDTFGSWF